MRDKEIENKALIYVWERRDGTARIVVKMLEARDHGFYRGEVLESNYPSCYKGHISDYWRPSEQHSEWIIGEQK